MENIDDRKQVWLDTKDRWFKKAKHNIRTPNDLRDFANELFGHVLGMKGEDYYNYSGLAASALSLASANLCACVFSMSAFQMGCVMWDFIDNTILEEHDVGMRLVNYNDMLYPQYRYRFDRKIDKETWESLRGKAAELLSKKTPMDSGVKRHIKSIADGKVPFGYKVEGLDGKGENEKR